MNQQIKLPEGYDLERLKREIFNLYYARDPVTLRTLLDKVKEVDHE